MGFLGGLARAAIPAVTGVMQGQMAGRDRQRQQQMEALQAMLLQERLNEIPLARKEREQDRVRQSMLDDQQTSDRMFDQKRVVQQDARQAELDARRAQQEAYGTKQQFAAPKIQARRDETLHRYRLEEIAAQNAGRLDVANTRGAGGPKMSTALLTALKNNDQRIRVLDSALANIGNYPNAVGLKGLVPDIALQRIDPAGVNTRADIADIGSMVIHDRSGAAVTVSEAPRLRPFIPAVTDTPDTVRRKLTRMRQIIAEDTEFLRANGSPGTGAGVGVGGGSTTSGRPSKADRWEELVDNGLSPNEATLQVQQEYGQ